MMSEYVFEDLIMNPETPNLERLIGKEVYFCDIPLKCLKCANKDDNCKTGILKEIRKDDMMLPFLVEIPNGMILRYACIIPKKEEPKSEFIPFTSAEEFIEEYDSANYSVSMGTMANRLLNYGGIWLKGKDSRAYYMVTEIWDCGLVIDDINMKTTKIEEDLYFTVNGVTHWDELLGYYTFLDGSPCGKLRKNK